MLYLQAFLCFLLARMIIRWNPPSPPTDSLPATRKWSLIILAVFLLFSSRAEQVLWNAFDPRVLDNERVVVGLSFSSDSRKLEARHFDGVPSSHVWDVATKKFVTQEREPISTQMSRVRSPDGNYVALWDTELFRRHKPGDPVQFDIWEWSAGKRVKLYRSISIEREKEPPIESVKWAQFSPDNQYLACAIVREKGVIEIWDIDSASFVKTLATNVPEFSKIAFAYSPDGRYIAAQHGVKNLVIWDIETDAADFSFTKENEGEISHINYSSDGKFLAVALDKSLPEERIHVVDERIYIWDVEARKMAQVLETGSIKRMAYSPDGKHIAVISRPADRVEIWDVEKGRQIDAYAGPILNLPVSAMAYSPDGKYLAVANSHYIKLYNLKK